MYKLAIVDNYINVIPQWVLLINNNKQKIMNFFPSLYNNSGMLLL